MIKIFGKVIVEIRRDGNTDEYVVVTVSDDRGLQQTNLVAILSNKVKDESCRGLYKYHSDIHKIIGVDLV